MLNHSLRYTGYETTHRLATASTTRRETETLRIADLISISIAPAHTLMPITLSNVPPTSTFCFHQMYEGDTLRKTDRSCVWKPSNVVQSVAVVAIGRWKYGASKQTHRQHTSNMAVVTRINHLPPSVVIIKMLCRFTETTKVQVNTHIVMRNAGSLVIESLP